MNIFLDLNILFYAISVNYRHFKILVDNKKPTFDFLSILMLLISIANFILPTDIINQLFFKIQENEENLDYNEQEGQFLEKFEYFIPIYKVTDYRVAKTRTHLHVKK